MGVRLVSALALTGLIGTGAGCTALGPGPTPSATHTASPSAARFSSALPSTGATAGPATSPARPGPVPTSESAAAPTRASPTAARGTALSLLAGLAVKGRAPKTDYRRDQFGLGWTDTNRNVCSTRQDVLRRDLDPVTVQAGTAGCDVVGGLLADPYSGRTIVFRKGATTSADVQVDHVVALSDAWQKGAQQWSPSLRVTFANDLLELLATDGPTNGAKRDSDAATWLPPNKPYRCAYVARQITVKARYGLWVTSAEKAAMDRVLSTCPGQPGISRSTETTAKAPSTEIDRAAPPPAPSITPEDGSPSYQNCAAVRAAGAAPIHAGEPGYSRRLDRDGDGVGCE